MHWHLTPFCFVDLPDEGPIISGGSPRYHLGDKVHVNCSSEKSKPAAKLRWYINGELADRAMTKKYKVSVLSVCTKHEKIATVTRTVGGLRSVKKPMCNCAWLANMELTFLKGMHCQSHEY